MHVGIVTAAGYPGEAWRFEARLTGLLAAFRQSRLPESAASRFFVMGGECNYLLRCSAAEGYRLHFLPAATWQARERTPMRHLCLHAFAALVV